MNTVSVKIKTNGAGLYRTGEALVRYSLVLVIAWIGAMKFTAFEAAAIEPLVASSPLMRWLYDLLSLRAVSTLLGLVELIVALLIALRPISAVAAAVGSGLAVLMFLISLSFLFTLPGWEPTLGGFPALSGAGGFLVKDVVLLAVAVWSLGESLSAAGKASSAG